MHLRKFQKLYNSNYPYVKLAKRYNRMSENKKAILLKEAETAGDKEILDLLGILNSKDSVLETVYLEEKEQPTAEISSATKPATKVKAKEITK